jgi:hypothetical protein
LDYPKGLTMKKSCAEQIRPEVLGGGIGLDRLATWKELRCAMEASSEGAMKRVGAEGRDVAPSGFSACTGILTDELEWLKLASEMEDRNSN